MACRGWECACWSSPCCPLSAVLVFAGRAFEEEAWPMRQSEAAASDTECVGWGVGSAGCVIRPALWPAPPSYPALGCSGRLVHCHCQRKIQLPIWSAFIHGRQVPYWPLPQVAKYLGPGAWGHLLCAHKLPPVTWNPAYYDGMEKYLKKAYTFPLMVLMWFLFQLRGCF